VADQLWFMTRIREEEKMQIGTSGARGKGVQRSTSWSGGRS